MPTQRARLLEIADKCPVHRTLTSEIEIRTTESWRGNLIRRGFFGTVPRLPPLA